jgi:hypothetical protein
MMVTAPRAQVLIKGDHFKPQTYKQEQIIWSFKVISIHDICITDLKTIFEPSSTTGIAQ